MWYVINSNELYHHGIKGQKWGVRRFQNPDGTLTANGRKRYGVDSQGRYFKKNGYIKRHEKIIRTLNQEIGSFDNVDSSKYKYFDKDGAKAGLLERKRVEEQKLKTRYETESEKQNGPAKLQINDSDSKVTRKAKTDYNNMSDQEFMKKYSVSKKVYADRVKKYGDPYMNSPLSKVGKSLQKSNKVKKYEQKRETLAATEKFENKKRSARRLLDNNEISSEEYNNLMTEAFSEYTQHLLKNIDKDKNGAK